jgi:hypothetical protein
VRERERERPKFSLGFLFVFRVFKDSDGSRCL